MSCDIVIPVWNKKELTQDCIESIISNTHYPYRIIVVDDASSSPAKEYLESLKNDRRLNFKLIRNEKNMGNTIAGNQGMRAATAEFICVLDNDTLVADGWLEEMARIANSEKNIGIVNPSSQRPKKSSLKEVMKCGQACKKFRGQFIEMATAVGFCFFVKREVIEKIGVWDEEFSPGYFEDTEYSLRARKAGYKCVLAKGAYIHHKEHSSFKDRSFEKLFKKSEQVFYRKCGKPKRILYILTKENREYFKKLEEEVYDLANKLNWIRIFIKPSLAGPDLAEHANIKLISIAPLFFRLHCAFCVLAKKKKYDQIFVDDARLLSILNKLSRFHKAKVSLIK